MNSGWWPLVPLAIALLSGCGESLGTPTANINRSEEVNLEESESVQIYNGLRNGLPPLEDQDRQSAIAEYIASAESLIASYALPEMIANPGCRRFVELNRETHRQLIDMFHWLSNPASMEPGPQLELRKARIEALLNLEAAMAAHAANGSEAGRALLDPTGRTSCEVSDRNQWESSHMDAYLKAEIARLAVFGQPPVISSVVHELSGMRDLIHRRQDEKTVKTAAFFIGEFIAVTYAWKRFVSPLSKKLASKSWAGRALINVLYALGIAGADRAARQHVGFLRIVPDFDNGAVVNEWDRLMSHTEELLRSPLNSPEFYLSLLRNTAALRRRQAFAYVQEHRAEIAEAGIDPDAVLKNLSDQIFYLSLTGQQRAAVMREELEGLYGYRIDCSVEPLKQLTLSQCLGGLYQLEIVLHNAEGEIDRLKIVDYPIHIVKGEFASPEDGSGAFEIPYDASYSSVYQFIKEAAGQ